MSVFVGTTKTLSCRSFDLFVKTILTVNLEAETCNS